MTRELTKKEVRSLGIRKYNIKYANGIFLSLVITFALCGIIILVMYAMDILPYNGEVPNPDWNALICVSPFIIWTFLFFIPYMGNQEIYGQKYVIKWLENNKELPDDSVDIEKD